MGGGTAEKDKIEDAEKEKHEMKEKLVDAGGKEERGEEKTKDKKKKDKESKDGKEKKKKNPEDKNDPTKLKQKLEKLETKMQALAIKRDEVLKLIHEAENAAVKPPEVA